jgi:hypothetical protein
MTTPLVPSDTMTQRNFSPRVLALLGFFLLTCVGGAFGATPCNQRIASETGKYVQSRVKALQRCEDRKVKAQLPASTNCASESSTAARIAKARAKFERLVAAACGGADKTCGNGDDTPLASIGWSGTCPGLGGTACPNPIGDCGDVATCLECIGDAAAGIALDTAYGDLASGQFGSNSQVNKCQRSVGKETAKYMAARAKAMGRCWAARLAGSHSNPCPSPGDGRALPLINRAEARKVAQICKACGGADGTCNGAGDLTPGTIGFASSCPAVQDPGGPACGGTVSALDDLVVCVDCVSAYAADCATVAAAPGAVAYPAACGGASTTTTTATTSSTTTTSPQAGTFLDFTTDLPGGICGATYSDTAGTTVIKNLTCGGLSLGGSGSTVPEGPTPDGSTNRYAADCTGGTCSLAATGGVGPGFDCTTTGCNFGAPLPIPNGGLSTCVQNRFSAPSSGTLDPASGNVSLNVALASDAVLTSNSQQPCPICRSGSLAGPPCAGSPGSPCAGICDGSGNQGSPCTSTNSTGLSRDCPVPAATQSGGKCYRGPNSGASCSGSGDCPGGVCAVFVGRIPVTLTPLVTDTAQLSSPTGNFCPGQPHAGCFTNPNSAACRLIREIGDPAGPVSMDVPADVVLASTFCVPASQSGLINGAASLPGPGATSLPGKILLHEVTTTTTTSTTAVTTTSTTGVTNPTTTSTSSSSTSSSTSTTTSTLPPAGTKVLDFTTTAGAGSCGSSKNASNAVITNLACGALDLGGGASTVPEGPVPDGATSRFLVSNCVGNACTLGASGGGLGIDCTAAGCAFGPPLPISNGGLSTCIVNSFATAGSGSVNLGTGALSLNIPLSSHVFVTGNETQPCPRCSAIGSPSTPAQGVCDRGARATLTCTTTNGSGLSSDCQPGGADGSSDLGSISVDLSPVVTSTASDSDANGLFCPGQSTLNNNNGCFGSTACRSFSENGTPAGALVTDVAAPVALASAFCIPATGNPLIDGAASLPGPGAASLSGTLTLREFTGPTTTTTSTTAPPTTTSAPGGTTTTTSTTTSSTTTLLPLPPLTIELSSTVPSGADCGASRNGSGTVLMPLACGDLALGGGNAGLPPSTLPDGAVNRFTLTLADVGCVLSGLTACPIGPTTTSGPGFDCTTTGCHFGPPVPVPNGALSACSVSTFAAPTSGTVNLVSGATTTNVSLNLHLYLTSNLAQPCPRCSATGSPGAPGGGTCDRGARANLACTTTNSQGLSNDCIPGGADGSVDLGSIAADLSPVTTGTSSQSNPSGIFCPSQAHAGCFGEPTCRSFSETGAAPNAALAGAAPQPTKLASTFCIPGTGNNLIDGSVDLPGPAAISLEGTIRASL